MGIVSTQQELLHWKQFKNGNGESFAAIFREYYMPLLNYGKKMTDNTELVEDCIQDLFAELWKTRGKADILSVKAYIFTAFKFKMLRMLQKNMRIVLPGSIKDDYAFVLSPEKTAMDKEEHDEKMQQLTTSLQNLTARQREIIYLRYYQCLEYEEISEIMQINYQAARNLCYQAIKVMKTTLLFLPVAFLLL